MSSCAESVTRANHVLQHSSGRYVNADLSALCSQVTAQPATQYKHPTDSTHKTPHLTVEQAVRKVDIISRICLACCKCRSWLHFVQPCMPATPLATPVLCMLPSLTPVCWISVSQGLLLRWNLVHPLPHLPEHIHERQYRRRHAALFCARAPLDCIVERANEADKLLRSI